MRVDRKGWVPTVPALPRSLEGRKHDGCGRAVIRKSTFRADGKVATGWEKWPHCMHLMWSRTTQRNVIGLCELVYATTFGTADAGDYDDVELSIEEIQGHLKISRREAYAARKAAVDLKWLEHHHESGVGELYRFFPQRIENTPELTDRRTRRQKPRTAYVNETARLAALRSVGAVHPDAQTRAETNTGVVHLDAQTSESTRAPDGAESVPLLCTGNESCPYLRESVGRRPAVSAEAENSQPPQQRQTSKSPLYSQLEDYLSNKFAARGTIRKKPDHALLVRLIAIIENRGATFEDFRCHAEARDKRDPIKSYGLLFDCARECLVGAESPVEESDNLTPEQRRYLQNRAARNARAGAHAGGDTHGVE
jgi:hypothetical protein